MKVRTKRQQKKQKPSLNLSHTGMHTHLCTHTLHTHIIIIINNKNHIVIKIYKQETNAYANTNELLLCWSSGIEPYPDVGNTLVRFHL